MTNKALVVFAHGKGYVLAWQGDEAVRQFIDDAIGEPECFDLDRAGVDYADPGDGLWIGDLSLFDDGPSDWTDWHEWGLMLENLRAATAEEWAAHRDDKWPWESEGGEGGNTC